MRNFIPLSVFAAAASLAALGTPSLPLDRLAATSEQAPAAALESSGNIWHVMLPREPAALQFTLPPCARNAGCAIRRPMT